MSDKLPKPKRKYKLGEKTYIEVLFLIKTRNIRGIPSECMMVEDEQTIHLKGGEEFMTALIQEHMTEGSL